MADMHKWYFEKGIFMSSSSRSRYFNLKNAIIDELNVGDIDLLQYVEKKSEYIALDEVKVKLDKTLTSIKQYKILKLASELRKSLANDIGARRENRLLSKRERRDS